MNYPKKTGFNLYQLWHCAYITYSVKTWFLKYLSVYAQYYSLCSSVAGVGLVEGVLGDGDDGRVEVDGRQVQQVAVSEVRRPYKKPLIMIICHILF